MEKEGFDTFQSHSTTHTLKHTHARGVSFADPVDGSSFAIIAEPTCRTASRTKMISRDLKLQRDKYSYWHCQGQWTMNLIIDNESNSDLFSQTITQTLTPKHTRRMCVCVVCFRTSVCVFSYDRTCLRYSLKGEQPPVRQFMGRVPWPDIRV